MIPSKSPYSRGWSSTFTARRLSAGLADGPLGTAHDFRTPSISSRRSQCRRVASCMWTMSNPPGFGAGLGTNPPGSGVSVNARFARYCASESGDVDFDLGMNRNSSGLGGQRRGAEIKIDRKSTRLNSSHGYISYAVFCLKKKKEKNLQRQY